MNGSVKVSFKEGTKNVTAEVVIEDNDDIKALERAKDLMEKAMKYSNQKTIQKYMD